MLSLLSAVSTVTYHAEGPARLLRRTFQALMSVVLVHKDIIYAAESAINVHGAA